jgi:SAM-dependent methyltransferase
MKNNNFPKENNWDYFWKLNTNSRFTKKSWSKIRMTKLLDEIIKEGMDVLDAGSGSGFFSNYFISKGCNVYSLDYSEDALNITKRLTNNRATAYLKEDLIDPGFGDRYAQKFDIIFSDGLFEHFSSDDQQKIMNNFKKIKKNKGIITTFVPNKYSWWEVIRPLVMPGIKEDPFTLKRLSDLHLGLIPIKIGGINALPFTFSPEKLLGSKIGMILYIFAK